MGSLDESLAEMFFDAFRKSFDERYSFTAAGSLSRWWSKSSEDYTVQLKSMPLKSMFHGISLALVGLLVCFTTGVQASSPQLSIIVPRGIQRGLEHELTFVGDRLQDTEEVLFYQPGVTVTGIEVVDAKNVKVKVQVSADCLLGEHIAQLRTRSGISEFRSFFVGALPAAAEAEPNGSLEEAQAIENNCTVEGVVTNEDVDLFKVTLGQGERLAVEVEALRLGTTLFDPYIAILDSKRFELAAVDDAPLVRQDGVLSIVTPEAGDYYVLVRESSYGGNGNCRYRMHIGSFPRPTAVYPAGGQAGQTTKVTLIGDAAGDVPLDVVAPAEVTEEFGVYAEDEGGIAPSSVPFRVSDFGNSLEQEPNNDFATATAAELPNAFNGIISEPGDIDCFRFSAKKGQVFDVECFARRARTGLDPVVNLYYGDGRGIAGNDDSRGPDSYLRFTVPEDGEYIIRVTDHLQRGQPDFVYRLEFLPLKPTLSLAIPRIDRYSQTRQTIYVPRGNRYAVLVNASRANFGGEITLEGNELPAGMSMDFRPMAANLNSMPVVFEAAADAEVGGKLMKFTGRHVDPNTGISGHFENNADFVLGPPNNTNYLTGHVEQLAVAVIDEVPFKLEIVQPQSPLVRNGSKNLVVRVERQEGFNQPVVVQFPFRSPGIGAPSSITINGDQSEGVYTLNANGNAQLGDWPVFVIGQSNHGGNAYVSSQLATLTVAEPLVTATSSRSSAEQGQEVRVPVTFAVDETLEGEATAELIGLPPKATAEPLKVTKDTTELAFLIKTEADVPVGKHKTPFVRMTCIVNGEPVVSSTGGFELQIDKPLPMETAKPAAPMPMPTPMPQATQPEPPKEKPLTRLEKLRLEAQKRKESSSEN